MSAPRHRLLSVLLLAIWFMATQHCALEAAGIFDAHAVAEAGSGCCSANADGCASDNCKTIEDAQYRSEVQSIKATAPELTVCLCLPHFSLLVPPPTTDALAAKERWDDEAPAWVPAWQFERRAAAPAHAPDSLIA